MTINGSGSESSAFINRHIGPNSAQQKHALDFLGYPSLDALANAAVPPAIRLRRPLALQAPLTEAAALKKMRQIAAKNQVRRSYIGLGYYPCITPPVIQRNILENPGWYTQYTPYQAEISQGRLEALLNFQTLVSDLTALPIANASLLDEATAAAEAMMLCFSARAKNCSNVFFVDSDCHPQTIAVIQTRAEPLGIEVAVGDPRKSNLSAQPAPFGVLLQYPGSSGAVLDPSAVIRQAKASGSMVVLAADLLALTLLKAPGELGADVAIGSAQRFGVPMGFGGPHAAFFATTDDHKRRMPGRLIGVSRDAAGQPALRMALQTREQHIRRDKATSNICTSQVLLAVMASMYAVYHGPQGLKAIASDIQTLTGKLAQGLRRLGYSIKNRGYFDTLTVSLGATPLADLLHAADSRQINLRVVDPTTVAVSLDEAATKSDVNTLFEVFAISRRLDFDADALTAPRIGEQDGPWEGAMNRESPFLRHQVFNSHHSETKMLRYIRRLEAKDLSLTRSMIPLGSCTMKLNSTSELMPISWPEFGHLHPFVPRSQALGYHELFAELSAALAECTGFAAISLQPNSGAQGEFAGLLVIRKYHQSRGEAHRNICLIPKSAHGTNPASAVLAGMRVIVVNCDDQGNIDVADLKRLAEEHSQNLAALMVTYPSTHGVFEESVTEICDIVHKFGGQVYMDGANMNAQVGLCRPGDFGPDVCHLNLHKTFCIPHGGGGPGMGPIGVKQHLAAFLPGHPIVSANGEVITPSTRLASPAVGPVSAAPWGSASILPISMMYIWMMGAKGLTQATQVAILNANYIAKKLDPHFPVLYKGKNDLVAHECIVDLRALKSKAGIEVEDVAKRLVDYGFHAPTVSFPVPGTLMIEPTESEDIEELERFCAAMMAIRSEIAAIENGLADRENNVLKNAPHTADSLVAATWDHPYTREQAVFPAPWVKSNKFWPAVSRIDGAYGDRNLMCTCAPLDSY